MALIDDVQARVPANHLIRLTNIDDDNPASVNLTVLGNVVSDVEGDLLTWCATEYSSDDKRMVSVGVMGVMHKLRIYAAGEAVTDALVAEAEEYRRRLQALAKVTGRDRLTPTSNGEYEPRSEPDGAPMFDDSTFDGVL